MLSFLSLEPHTFGSKMLHLSSFLCSSLHSIRCGIFFKDKSRADRFVGFQSEGDQEDDGDAMPFSLMASHHDILQEAMEQGGSYLLVERHPSILLSCSVYLSEEGSKVSSFQERTRDESEPSSSSVSSYSLLPIAILPLVLPKDGHKVVRIQQEDVEETVVGFCVLEGGTFGLGYKEAHIKQIEPFLSLLMEGLVALSPLESMEVPPIHWRPSLPSSSNLKSDVSEQKSYVLPWSVFPLRSVFQRIERKLKAVVDEDSVQRAFEGISSLDQETPFNDTCQLICRSIEQVLGGRVLAMIVSLTSSNEHESMGGSSREWIQPLDFQEISEETLMTLKNCAQSRNVLMKSVQDEDSELDENEEQADTSYMDHKGHFVQEGLALSPPPLHSLSRSSAVFGYDKEGRDPYPSSSLILFLPILAGQEAVGAIQFQVNDNYQDDLDDAESQFPMSPTMEPKSPLAPPSSFSPPASSPSFSRRKSRRASSIKFGSYNASFSPFPSLPPSWIHYFVSSYSSSLHHHGSKTPSSLRNRRGSRLSKRRKSSFSSSKRGRGASFSFLPFDDHLSFTDRRDHLEQAEQEEEDDDDERAAQTRVSFLLKAGSVLSMHLSHHSRKANEIVTEAAKEDTGLVDAIYGMGKAWFESEGLNQERKRSKRSHDERKGQSKLTSIWKRAEETESVLSSTKSPLDLLEHVQIESALFARENMSTTRGLLPLLSSFLQAHFRSKWGHFFSKSSFYLLSPSQQECFEVILNASHGSDRIEIYRRVWEREMNPSFQQALERRKCVVDGHASDALTVYLPMFVDRKNREWLLEARQLSQEDAGDPRSRGDDITLIVQAQVNLAGFRADTRRSITSNQLSPIFFDLVEMKKREYKQEAIQKIHSAFESLNRWMDVSFNSSLAHFLLKALQLWTIESIEHERQKEREEEEEEEKRRKEEKVDEETVESSSLSTDASTEPGEREVVHNDSLSSDLLPLSFDVQYLLHSSLRELYVSYDLIRFRSKTWHDLPREEGRQKSQHHENTLVFQQEEEESIPFDQTRILLQEDPEGLGKEEREYDFILSTHHFFRNEYLQFCDHMLTILEPLSTSCALVLDIDYDRSRLLFPDLSKFMEGYGRERLSYDDRSGPEEDIIFELGENMQVASSGEEKPSFAKVFDLFAVSPIQEEWLSSSRREDQRRGRQAFYEAQGSLSHLKKDALSVKWGREAEEDWKSIKEGEKNSQDPFLIGKLTVKSSFLMEEVSDAFFQSIASIVSSFISTCAYLAFCSHNTFKFDEDRDEILREVRTREEVIKSQLNDMDSLRNELLESQETSEQMKSVFEQKRAEFEERKKAWEEEHEKDLEHEHARSKLLKRKLLKYKHLYDHELAKNHRHKRERDHLSEDEGDRHDRNRRESAEGGRLPYNREPFKQASSEEAEVYNMQRRHSISSISQGGVSWDVPSQL
jgi:hypothetical protein